MAEECERLFCGSLAAVFLGEGGQPVQRPLATDAHYRNYSATMVKHGLVTPGQSPEVTAQQKVDTEPVPVADADMLIQRWLEVYDYAGGARFRGFIAAKEDERAMFVFFDDGVLASDLKPG